MNNQVFSKAWGLIKQDLIKVGKGLILAILGALVAFIGQVSGLIDYSQYGQYGPFVALTARTGNIYNSTSDLSIGRLGSASSDYFPGNIDEVIVENVVWTPEYIKKYYTYSKGRFGIL